VLIKFQVLRDVITLTMSSTKLKKSNKMQQHADIYLLLNYSTCFGRPSRPSSGVYKTVVAASGTDLTIWGASFLKRDQRSRLRKYDHTTLGANFLKRDQMLRMRKYYLYQRLQLQLYALLMIGAMDARNM